MTVFYMNFEFGTPKIFICMDFIGRKTHKKPDAF